MPSLVTIMANTLVPRLPRPTTIISRIGTITPIGTETTTADMMITVAEELVSLRIVPVGTRAATRTTGGPAEVKECLKKAVARVNRPVSAGSSSRSHLERVGQVCCDWGV